MVEVKQIDIDELFAQLREQVPKKELPPITKEEATAAGYRVVTVCADDGVKTRDGAG